MASPDVLFDEESNGGGFKCLGPFLPPDIAKPRFREIGSGRKLHQGGLLFRAESIGGGLESVRPLVPEEKAYFRFRKLGDTRNHFQRIPLAKVPRMCAGFIPLGELLPGQN